jgi:hypothetical protein
LPDSPPQAGGAPTSFRFADCIVVGRCIVAGAVVTPPS